MMIIDLADLQHHWLNKYSCAKFCDTLYGRQNNLIKPFLTFANARSFMILLIAKREIKQEILGHDHTTNLTILAVRIHPPPPRKGDNNRRV